MIHKEQSGGRCKLLFAADGSTLSLPRTDELMRIFGGATNRSESEPDGNESETSSVFFTGK